MTQFGGIVFCTSLLHGYIFSVKSINLLKSMHSSIVSGVELSEKVAELLNSEIGSR